MPEGLQLLVTADTKQAEAALNNFVGKAEAAGTKAGAGFNKGLSPTKSILGNIPSQAQPAIKAVSKLGDTGKTAFNEIGTAVVKSTGELGGFASGAKRSISSLKGVANIIAGFAGVGVAGLVGAAVEFFGDLISGADEASAAVRELLVNVNNVAAAAGAGTGGDVALVKSLAAAVQDQTKSYTERNNALLQLKDINKNYFGDLTLEAASLATLKSRVEEYTQALIQQAVVKQFTDNIAKVTVAMTEQLGKVGKAGAVLKKYQREVAGLTTTLQGQAVAQTAINGGFGGDVQGDFDKSVKGYQLLAAQLDSYKKALDKAVGSQLKLKPLDAPAKGETQEQKMQKLISQAQKLADFLDSTTIRSFRFEVDPRDTLKQTYDKAVEFIDKAVKTPRSFKFKQAFFEVGDNAFDKIKEAFLKFDIQGADLRKNLQSEVDNAFAKNPIVIQAKLFLDTNKQRAAEAATKSGVNIEGLNAPVSLLTKTQKQAINTANTVRDILTPAFQDLFTAIKDGENPLKAFFQGIGDAIGQLIQKLIAAAIQAAILSALFPGGLGGAKGFKGFFKSITGFAAGGIVSGPTLAMVGEGRGTSRSNPEVIAPLDQLKGILSGLGGGGSQRIEIVGRTRGQDIRYSQVRTSKRNLRNTGA